MTAVFFKFLGRCGRTWFLLACLALDPLVARSADTTWDSRNVGAFIGNPAPSIDATNFYNEATWGIGLITSPYTTADTLNYTNIGNMSSSVGWEFDWVPPNFGQRGMSANFVNNAGGAIIQAVDGSIVNLLQQSVPQSYLWISATNLINKGTLAAGANGEIRLTGKNVNLAHSGLEITPIAHIPGSGVNDSSGTNFTGDAGFYSLFWEPTNNFVLTGSIWDGTSVVGTIFFINSITPCGQTNFTIFPAPARFTFVDSFSTNTGLLPVTYTNSGGSTTTVLLPTNQIRQAVFVFVADTNFMTASIHLSPSGNPTNFFDTIAVRLSSPFTNVVTGQSDISAIYIVDDYASSTNRGLANDKKINPAAACNTTPLRPNNFVVSRSDPGDFAAGQPGFGPPSAIFLYDPLTFSNLTVNGTASDYGVEVDNQAAQVPAGTSITNIPGRVRIYADNLNLNQTKVRAEGQIMIQATNLISSVNATMDCQNLSFKLGSATGNLNFTSLVPPLVNRLNGMIQMTSILVTNFQLVVLPNFAASNTVVGGVTNVVWVSAPLTNALQVSINISEVDAKGLTNTAPVTVQDLDLRGTNMVISDSMTVDESFQLLGQAATVQGILTLSGLVQQWVFTNAPSLRYFTNNGRLSIPDSAHFGDDGPTNYLAFVNNGAIFAGGQSINSVNLQLNFSQNLTFSGGFYAVTQTGQLNGAAIRSQSDIQFTANTLQISRSFLSAQGALNFTVAGSLTDGGAAKPNTFTCQNGFNLWVKPATGSLLGTTIQDVALGESIVNHVWAGQDVGRSTSGFVNNAALNTLALAPSAYPQPAGYEPLFEFSAATGNNALYVSNLDLSLLTDYANEIQIDPGMRIYFATAKLNPGVVIAPFPDAEHFLDGKFGDQLRWVGVTSFINIPANALVQKFQLTANYDTAARQFQLTENLMPGQTNVTEASTDLLNWVPICTNISSYSNFGPVTITDPDSQAYRSRFYRFRILP